MKKRIVCCIIAGPCIVAMPIWFSVKIIVAFILGYLIEWMFDYIDDNTTS